jgi:hypothetical protein
MATARRPVDQLRARAEGGEALGLERPSLQRAFLSFARASCFAIT